MLLIGIILTLAANLSNSTYAGSASPEQHPGRVPSPKVATARALYFTPSSASVALDEAQLKAWLKDQQPIQKKLAAAAKEMKVMDAEDGATDLRDALGRKPDLETLPKKIAQANAAQRRSLLERLPGMEPVPFESCRTLESCPEAAVLLHVDDPGLVEDTVAAIIRPWMLLQKAKGKEFGVVAAKGSGDQILRLKLEDLPNVRLEVHVSAMPIGGINVWLRGRQDPAGLYASERHSVLASAASTQ